MAPDPPAVWRCVAWTAVLAGVAASAASCGQAAGNGRASSLIVIDRLSGAPGADPASFNTFLQSDVVTAVRTTVNGEAVLVPTVLEDPGQVVMRLALRDPGPPSAPSSANWVTISRYRVAYRRADGRNAPGVDVPHPFDGAITFTVTDVGSAVFTLVRAQAKLEAPLLALRGGGGAIVISTLADVTFYGRDQTGTDVSVTGSIGINFADWGDRE